MRQGRLPKQIRSLFSNRTSGFQSSRPYLIVFAARRCLPKGIQSSFSNYRSGFQNSWLHLNVGLPRQVPA